MGSLIANQPGFISKVPEYIQQPDLSLLPIKTKKESIIPSVPGNIPATEQPASFISLDLGQQRYIEEVPGVVLNIDREKRELILADGLLVPYEKNDFHLDVADGAITMNDKADAIRIQRFIHKPTQPGGKKLFEDADEIGVIYGATLRAYSVLHSLLCASFPLQILLFIRPLSDSDANSLNHERRIDAFEYGIKRKYKDGYDEIPKDASLKGDFPKIYLASNICTGEDFIYPTPACRTPIDCMTVISPSSCECLEIGDPRAGDACPFYCTRAYQPDSNCVYDSNPVPNNGYPLHECQSSKLLLSINTPQRCTHLCTSTDFDPLIISDSCFCTDTDYHNWLSMSKLIPQNQQEYPKQIVSVFLQLIIKQMVFALLIAQDLINRKLIMFVIQIYMDNILYQNVERQRCAMEMINQNVVAVRVMMILHDIRSGDTCPVARVCQTDDDLITPCNCSSDFHESGCACNPNFFPSGCRCFIKKDKYYLIDYGLAFDKINIKELPLYIYVNDTSINNNGTYPTLEAIARWADDEVSISRNPITRMNYARMNTIKYFNETGEHKVNKLLIDLRGNGGGQIRLGRQLLNFLFPNVGHPVHQIVNEIKTDINEAIVNITLYDLDKKPKEAQLPLELDYMGIDKLFYSRGNRNRTTQSENKKNVLIATDGACASTCSQFVKHIGEKHLERIIEFITDASHPLTKEDKSKLPNKFYRIGTDLSWSNKGGYGFTDETSDQLLEYKIVDADFRVEYFPFDSLISDEDEQRFALYDEVLKREKELLGNDTISSTSYVSASNYDQIHKSISISNPEPLPPNKCLLQEVETNNTQTPNNCKGCLRNDPYSIYDHPCSVRGSSEAKGRYSNGTAKIGEYLTDKCIFSHCKVGYYRNNYVIGQKINQKCSLVPLGPNQNRSEINPDQTEDEVKDNNPCDMLVIVDEQEEQEEGEEEEQQSDQDKQK
ncbi:MAG: hypothetical protein EZS28_016781, partial [Streblomastix strix]